MKKLTSIICLLLFITCSVRAAEYAIISDMGVSAKSIALGNIEGFSENSTAVFTNPASLSPSKGYSVSMFSTTVMNEVKYYSISMSGETPVGKIGIGIYEARVSHIPDTAQRDDKDKSLYAKSYWDYKNSTIKLSYQTMLSEKTSVGASYSFFDHNLYTKIRGKGVNVDAGLVHEFKKFDMSVFAQNIIPNRSVVYTNSGAEPLPFFISSTIKYPYTEFTVYPQFKYGQSMMLFSCGIEYNPAFMTFMKALIEDKEGLDYSSKRQQKVTFGVELDLIGLQVPYEYEQSDYFLFNHTSYISFNYKT